MAQANEAWTDTHDLSLIFIALAYGTDHDLSGHEQQVIVDVLGQWQGQFPEESPEEIVVETLLVYTESEEVAPEVIASMKSLKEHLSHDEREQALGQVVRIAEADGVLLNSERSLISSLADVWELKETARDLLAQVTSPEEDAPGWSLMHDIALMYLVVAHSTDDNLSERELAAITDSFKGWRPRVTDDEIRDVLRDALTFYAGGPEQHALETSARSVKRLLSVGQRLAVLSDLMHIAEADGTVNRHEREMIGLLAEGWEVGVRFEGDAFVSTNGKA